MSYRPPAQIEAETVYEPNEEQRTRAAALRRFNWLYVYTPLIIGVVIVLVLIGLMFWGVFAPPVEEQRLFISGLADIAMIFFAMPMILLCSVGPIALVGMVAYRVQKRQERKDSQRPLPQGGPIQRQIWRLDALLDRIYGKIMEITPKVARPVIQLNAMLAYIETLWARFKKRLTRS